MKRCMKKVRFEWVLVFFICTRRFTNRHQCVDFGEGRGRRMQHHTMKDGTSIRDSTKIIAPWRVYMAKIGWALPSVTLDPGKGVPVAEGGTYGLKVNSGRVVVAGVGLPMIVRTPGSKPIVVTSGSGEGRVKGRSGRENDCAMMCNFGMKCSRMVLAKKKIGLQLDLDLFIHRFVHRFIKGRVRWGVCERRIE